MKTRTQLTQLAAMRCAVLMTGAAFAAETAVNSNGPKPVGPEVSGEEKAVLTQAPLVPPPI